jgi:hypothetical protein
LGAAKAHVDLYTAKLGIRFGPDDISISRADYCVDILAPDFELIPDHFVMHSATGRRDHITPEETVVHGKSGRVTSVTIGGTRNRQVIVYDKRAEVIARGKSYWWDIWNHTIRTCKTAENGSCDVPNGYITPNPDFARENCVWRVEFRAGKNLLKDRWGIRTWKQFFELFGSERPFADLGRSLAMLRCGPSNRTFVHFAAFLLAETSVCGQSCRSKAYFE